MAMDRPALLPDATIILTIMVGPRGGNRTGNRGAEAVRQDRLNTDDTNLPPMQASHPA